MSINDDVTVICTADQAACKDNEYGHLFNYGAGAVFGSGITTSSPGPFSNVQSGGYWSGTEFAPNPTKAWNFNFNNGNQFAGDKGSGDFSWAVHSGEWSPSIFRLRTSTGSIITAGGTSATP